MVGVGVALIFYAVLLPAWAWYSMAKHAKDMYYASTVYDTDM